MRPCVTLYSTAVTGSELHQRFNSWKTVKTPHALPSRAASYGVSFVRIWALHCVFSQRGDRRQITLCERDKAESSYLRKDGNMWVHSDWSFYSGPVIASGYCRYLRLCDNAPPVQARITKFGPEVQNNIVKTPIVLCVCVWGGGGGGGGLTSRSSITKSRPNLNLKKVKKKCIMPSFSSWVNTVKCHCNAV